MSLKLFQGRVFITIVITDAFDVDVGYVGGQLLVRSDHVHRVCNGDVSHDAHDQQRFYVNMSRFAMCGLSQRRELLMLM